MNHSWSLDFLNVSVDLSGKAQEKRKTIISIFSESRLSRSNNELGDHLYNCYTSREPIAYSVSTKFRLELIEQTAREVFNFWTLDEREERGGVE